ncbi:MAG: hypothetical protein GF350_15155, partial [Chitinivibrionales bacterium]|nr:hypothetical protein [Chitinivibrionales bacterium]
MKSRIVVIFALLVVGAASGERGTCSAKRTICAPLELGFCGYASVEDREFNALGSFDGAWWFRCGALVRYRLAFEEKHNSFFKVWNSVSAGYGFAFEKAAVPLWFGGGVTTTGLWKHLLNRPFGAAGAGIRLY